MKHKEDETDSSVIMGVFAPFADFCHVLLDAYVVIDAFGKISHFNQAFLSLTGIKQRQVQSSGYLDEILTLYIDGECKTVAKLMEAPQILRLDDVKADCKGRKGIDLTVGIYPFWDDNNKLIGMFFQLRDVTAEVALQGKYKERTHKSETDHLTGLYNRRYFDSVFRAMVTDIAKPTESVVHQRMSMLLIDLDHFKKINDTHGHAAGDFVLKNAARVMRKALRRTDDLFRYGGEEFLGLLNVPDLEGAYLAAEKLRLLIETTPFVYNDRAISVTISAGVSAIILGENAEDAIRRADVALYRAKGEGRNRIAINDGSKVYFRNNGVGVAI